MRLRVLLTLTSLVLGLAAVLAAESLAKGTYAPQAPITKTIRGTSCWVDSYGPVFHYNKAGYWMSYGGAVGCPATAQIPRSLTVYVQVASQHRPTRYFTIFGSGLVQGPVTTGYLKLRTSRTAYLGHGYRVLAIARVRWHGTTKTQRIVTPTWAP